MNVWQTFWRNNVYERGPLIRLEGGDTMHNEWPGTVWPPHYPLPPASHFSFLSAQTDTYYRTWHKPHPHPANRHRFQLSHKKNQNKRRRQQLASKKIKGQTIFGTIRGTLYHLSPNTQRHPSNKGSSFLRLSGSGSARLNRSDCCYRSAASDGPQVNLGADERQDAVLLQPFSWTMIMTRHYWGQSPRGNETFCCHRPAFIRGQ